MKMDDDRHRILFNYAFFSQNERKSGITDTWVIHPFWHTQVWWHLYYLLYSFMYWYPYSVSYILQWKKYAVYSNYFQSQIWFTVTFNSISRNQYETF